MNTLPGPSAGFVLPIPVVIAGFAAFATVHKLCTSHLGTTASLGERVVLHNPSSHPVGMLLRIIFSKYTCYLHRWIRSHSKLKRAMSELLPSLAKLNLYRLTMETLDTDSDGILADYQLKDVFGAVGLTVSDSELTAALEAGELVGTTVFEYSEVAKLIGLIEQAKLEVLARGIDAAFEKHANEAGNIPVDAVVPALEELGLKFDEDDVATKLEAADPDETGELSRAAFRAVAEAL
eukprot:gnl/Chilomastix_cuspidata/3151.p1 GENE.gnl/Chilomastix_cuspidata/3151~~gnl/Chilomastix_cuspidata/3151.p1  ORF type:complete len:236 (+),score=47.48 gnl/Chilomastix_cuspidata/3151:295-1002(+)